MSRGLDISDCAEAIYIRARYLAAIEDGRFEVSRSGVRGGLRPRLRRSLGVPLDGFGEPDRELPVRRPPDRGPRPVYLSPTRVRGRGGRRVGSLAWSLVVLITLAALIGLALWFGVIDTAAAAPGL